MRRLIIGDEGLDTAKLHRESQPALEAMGALIADGSPAPGAFLAERQRDSVQSQAHPRADDRAVDADELQVSA